MSVLARGNVESLRKDLIISIKRLGRGYVEFKKYLHGVSDAGTRLLFKFMSGTHGLNEELGRHRGREGSRNVLCVVLSVRV